MKNGVPEVGDIFIVDKEYPQLKAGTRVVCVAVDLNDEGEVEFIRVVSKDPEGRMVEDSFGGKGNRQAMSNWESDLRYFDFDDSLRGYVFIDLSQLSKDGNCGVFSRALGPWQR